MENYWQANFSGFKYFLLLGIFIISQSPAFSESFSSREISEKAPGLSKKEYIIAIDPGHPSETSNGCSHYGLSEMEICWKVAIKLEELIASDTSLKSVMTKKDLNQMVTNRKRAEIANEAKAAVMVRLHCDSGKGTGCTLYYPDKAGTKFGVTGPSETVIAKSKLAAEYMQKGIGKTLGKRLKLNPLRTDSLTYVGSKQGALTGSIFSKVPAIVVEMVYLNNKSDADFIKTNEGKQLMAEAIFNGIKEFLNSKKE